MKLRVFVLFSVALLNGRASADCNAAASSYGSDAKATSSLSWDCARFLGTDFVTHSVFTTPTVYATATHTSTVYLEPKRWVTETYTSYGTHYLSTRNATYTHTEASYGVTSTTYYPKLVFTSTWTSARTTPTVVVTVGQLTVTAPTLATTTVTGPPVFVSKRPIPSRFINASDCSENQLDSFCKTYISAPVPTPVTTAYIGFPGTRTEYPWSTTVTTTESNSVSTTQRWIPHITTVRFNTLYHTTTTLATYWSGVLNPDPSATIVSTKTYTSTNTLTLTVTASARTTISTKTVVATPTISIPPICNDPEPFADSFAARYFANGPYDGRENWLPTQYTDTRVQCCALCHATPGCSFYMYDPGYKTCLPRVVSQVPERGGPGWVTDTCPIGQIAGDFMEKPAEEDYDPIRHDMYLGPCYNGWKQGVPHVRQLVRGYNACLDPNPIAGC